MSLGTNLLVDSNGDYFKIWGQSFDYETAALPPCNHLNAARNICLDKMLNVEKSKITRVASWAGYKVTSGASLAANLASTITSLFFIIILYPVHVVGICSDKYGHYFEERLSGSLHQVAQSLKGIFFEVGVIYNKVFSSKNDLDDELDDDYNDRMRPTGFGSDEDVRDLEDDQNFGYTPESTTTSVPPRRRGQKPASAATATNDKEDRIVTADESGSDSDSD